MRLDSSLRWNDEDSTPVIPGEQRETRNPGGITGGQCSISLDARLRGHDGIKPLKIMLTDY
jgi:hypothetical protein